MAQPTHQSWQRAIVLLTRAILVVIVIGAMYWMEPILLPIALAIFFSLILAPLVSLLQRLGLRRTPAAILVVLTVGMLLISLGWLFSTQVTSLVAELPEHRHKISAKLKSLQDMMEGGVSQKLRDMVEDIKDDLKKDVQKGAISTPAQREPAPSEARPVDARNDSKPGSPEPTSVTLHWDWQAWITQSANSILAGLASGFLALVLVVFILTYREDLRDRLMRLVGESHITATTKAVEEAFQRVSRFLLMQACLNALFGLVIALLFWWLGLKYALLWGVLAGVMRYLPYLGVWVAAIFPVALSVALSDSWTQPILIFGLFLALELIVANVIEPLLFGHSAGVTPVALLISAAFWAFLWGPIGMVLSIPLTVMLVVVGRYVPQLEFLTVLLSDEPALPARVSWYQRLLAREAPAALELAQQQAAASSLINTQDDLGVGALMLLKNERLQGHIRKDEELRVVALMRDLMEKLSTADSAKRDSPEVDPSIRPARLLICPARDEEDRLAAAMLAHQFPARHWSVEVLEAGTLAGELIAKLREEPADLLCIGSIPPGGLVAARYLVKRVRREHPMLKIVVGRWGIRGGLERNTIRLQDVGADAVAFSLEETRDQLNTWRSIVTSAKAKTAGSRRQLLATH